MTSPSLPMNATISNSDDAHFPDLYKIATTLFPLKRCLMGDAVNISLDYLESLNPYFRRLSFPSGYQAFDWIVPNEWNLKRATLIHESGLVVADSDRNFLEAVLYSQSLDIHIDKKDLISKLHYSDARPSAIPYHTSYYKKDWGFCLSKQASQILPDGTYHAQIKATFEPGHLSLSHAVIPGNTTKEILFTSYICHPNMANNEVSGPTVIMALANYISNLDDRHYTYRFVLAPETIGALCYLSLHLSDLRINTISGFVLSCLGDDRAYSHISSPTGANASDIALEAALIGKQNVTRYSFCERGSDERQYCSPNVDLPVCGFCRSKYGTYSEYHTSDDDLSLISEKGLQNSFDVLRSIVDCYEFGVIPKLTTTGEPCLGSRGLYQTLDNVGSRSLQTQNIENIIAFADGVKTFFEICRITNMPLENCLQAAKQLERHQVIKVGYI